MDQTVIKYRHCGRDIYCFSCSNARFNKQTDDLNRRECPICRHTLTFGLLDAPVAITCPFINAHKVSCAFIIGSVHGPSHLGEWLDTEIHVGLTNSQGLVYNYTLSGVQRDDHGWEQCVCVQLVPPWRHDLRDSWDRELNEFSLLPEWVSERFHEEREFGSCCYGFALTFINRMRSLDGKVALSRDQCPECGVSFSGKRLEEAPVSIPNPFSNGHKVPCAFLVAPTEDNVLREFNGQSDLHTGITNTDGVVYNYTKTGVHRDHQGWERCICIPLVQPDMFNLISQWDQYLEKFSSAQMWDPSWQSFNEETHNCYSYTLMFINCVLATQSKRALSKDEFTNTFVLPRIRRTTKYMMLCREISQNHFYIVNNPRRNPQQSPYEEEENNFQSS